MRKYYSAEIRHQDNRVEPSAHWLVHAIESIRASKDVHLQLLYSRAGLTRQAYEHYLKGRHRLTSLVKFENLSKSLGFRIVLMDEDTYQTMKDSLG